jgi:hypothetical protein
MTGLVPVSHASDARRVQDVETRRKAGHDEKDEVEQAMSSKALRIEDAVNETCPWSGKPIAADSLTLYRGEVVGFCNPGCRDKFEAAISHFEKALADRDVPLIARGID